MFQYIFFLLLYPALLTGSVYLGYLYSERRLQKSKAWTNIGLESSLMSIYALLLSFTLVLSSNHSSERNDQIYKVADKLSFLVKKSKFYETDLKKGMNVYLTQFFSIHNQNLRPDAIKSASVIKEIIQNDQQLDYFLLNYLKERPESRAEISEITTNTSGLRSEYIRLTENYGKGTPTLIISILIVYSLMMGFLIGFMNRMHNIQTYLVTTIFITISSIMVGAIWDQDHPAIGLLQPNYQSITDVSDLFNAYLKREYT